jgi:hypothetical protein
MVTDMDILAEMAAFMVAEVGLEVNSKAQEVQ